MSMILKIIAAIKAVGTIVSTLVSIFNRVSEVRTIAAGKKQREAVDEAIEKEDSSILERELTGNEPGPTKHNIDGLQRRKIQD